MLRWLPKRYSKHELYFLQLLGIVYALHVFFLITMMYVACRTPLAVNVGGAIMRNDMPIIVLPFIKRTGQLEQFARGKLKPSRVRNLVKRDTGKPVVKQVGKKGAAAQYVRKHNASTHVLKNKVPINGKNVPKPERPHQVLLKKSKVRARVAPHEKVAKKIERDMQRVEKIDKQPKKEPVVERNPEPSAAVIEQSAPIQTEVAQLPPEVRELVGPLDITVQASTSEGDELGTGPLVIGQQELEELQRYQEVQEQIAPHWQPPIGLHVSKACVLLITVTVLGRVDQLTVEQSSGVLAYDMAARMAVHRAQLPAGVWGQQIRLHF